MAGIGAGLQQGPRKQITLHPRAHNQTSHSFAAKSLDGSFQAPGNLVPPCVRLGDTYGYIAGGRGPMDEEKTAVGDRSSHGMD